jgi:Rod binding domain-containing protein
MNVQSATASGPAAVPVSRTEEDRLKQVARRLEASFVAEMLRGTGFGEPREGFGGGIGEEQFGSFLRDEIADGIVRAGGFGLAESIFQSLSRMESGR